MGLFKKLEAYSAGQLESIECKTCGSRYRANIDRRFPYAVCGSCLEKVQNDARRNGDNDMYSKAHWEFDRRRSL